MIEPLTWLESLACAACVTATDPVLASSVVGKGKFAKRVPKHLRDLLSAESGCNDGMAFPFIYLSIYLIDYRPNASEVALNWFCITILYECLFGAVYGFTIGYIARHAIKWAESKGIIDRESFLVFYFVLALFCAGSGSLLGLDDLLVGFATGVGFSNDGWFTQKTEESHVSNVIDLLLNLAYFVYLGSIIPWEQYNAPAHGTEPWRLVIIAIFVLLFRRIPIMLALKPIIPDIKTWREALFAGHFGPIGVGAIFAAILARAELESNSTVPLAELPPPGSENYAVVYLIWPITTFLVITSIIVHGSSIAVFTLGKRINTLSITMSYTQANEEGPSWMNRLPRIQSQSKGSMSFSKQEDDFSSSNERLDIPPGSLPPIGVPGNFLRRQREEDDQSAPVSRAASQRSSRRRRKWDAGMGPGGPISQSAITPQKRSETLTPSESPEETLGESVHQDESPDADLHGEGEGMDGVEMEEKARRDAERKDKEISRGDEPELEVFEEGHDVIIEDEEGNVLAVEDSQNKTREQKSADIMAEKERLENETSGEHAKGKYHPHEKSEGEEMEKDVQQLVGHPEKHARNILKKWHGFGRANQEGEPSKAKQKPPSQQKRGPAHAYQYGNTIIVEDEDGEVVKEYSLPNPEKKKKETLDPSKTSDSVSHPQARRGLQRMGTWVGRKDPAAAIQPSSVGGEPGEKGPNKRKLSKALDKLADDDDDRIRFTVESGGRRMSKQDFIRSIQQLDPKARCEVVEESNAPEHVKKEARSDKKEYERRQSKPDTDTRVVAGEQEQGRERGNERGGNEGPAQVQRVAPNEDRPAGQDGLTLVDSNNEDIPIHDVSSSLAKYAPRSGETAAQRRRRIAAANEDPEVARAYRSNSSSPRGRATSQQQPRRPKQGGLKAMDEETGETAAEKRRRLAALGTSGPHDDDSEESDEDGTERIRGVREPVGEGRSQPRGGGGGRAGGGELSPITAAISGHRRGVSETRPGIRFADLQSPSQDRRNAEAETETGEGARKRHRFGTISWGGEKGR